MIPHQIQLKNFLSYGPETQTVDFTKYNLICLSGKNGHGKSALLDAITWAIWGQARKTSGNSKADQGLLHLGQKSMLVIIEFEVNGQLYRIRREFIQTKSKPFSSLEFGIMQEDKMIASLTDKTIKSTQAKIEKTIGITYDSFVNSAFLRQGQSNEFSKKSPKERKEILAEILHLQQFEDQKKIATAQAKKLQLEFNTQNSIVQRIETELEQLADTNKLYKDVQKSYQAVQKNKTTLNKELTVIQKEKQTCLQQLNEKDLLVNQLQQTEQEFNNSIKIIQSTADTLRATQVTCSKKEIEKVENEQKELQQKLLKTQDALQKKLVFKEDYLKIREKLTTYKHTLEKELETSIQKQTVELTKQQEQHIQLQKQLVLTTQHIQNNDKEVTKLQQHIHALEAELKSHEKEIKEFEQHETEFERSKYQYQHICVQGTVLKEELATLINKDLQQCITCEQSLSEKAKQTVLQKNNQQEQTLTSKIEQLKVQANSLKTSIATQHTQMKEFKKQHEQSINLATQKQEALKQIKKITLHIEELHKQLKEIDQQIKATAQTITEQEKTITTITKDLVNIPQHKACQSLQKKLDTIEKQAKQLAYNPNEHKLIKQRMIELQDTLRSYKDATQALDKQKEIKTTLLSLYKETQKLNNQIKQYKKQIASFHDLESKQKSCEQYEKEYLQKLKLLEQEQSNLLVQKGSLEQKQAKAKELTKELSKRSKEIKVVQQEMIDYQEIAKALGKDGIQALLIEQAIPEIEEETNQVLARLTNNQTQIFIESLRDLKKGGSKETLDIKISDSFGLRDYEMFSGGEAFRIDFALRIGISKLLARKAGTTLQTIFIDEGFGSQDEEGLQLIMDNIYKVQDDFAKVIVVSHLPEMKEQFPVQFIVEKKRSGSAISVIEQG